jgi:hypothetical protein
MPYDSKLGNYRTTDCARLASKKGGLAEAFNAGADDSQQASNVHNSRARLKAAKNYFQRLAGLGKSFSGIYRGRTLKSSRLHR